VEAHVFTRYVEEVVARYGEARDAARREPVAKAEHRRDSNSELARWQRLPSPTERSIAYAAF
jgi:hypothetical protein